ncbi:hypothetical protein KLP28_08520 [Nocardioidaceae bacterium]|nr:hypothetical protein KLP28_08520 [Nocardioidaceae bacterium]
MATATTPTSRSRRTPRTARAPRVIVASDPDLARRGRRGLMLATVLVALGSFLPWIHTAVGNVPGYAGAGLWTFYVSMLGFAGMFIPWLRVAAGQAAVMGAVALALTTWQLVRLTTLVGFSGWLPGFGLLMVLGGGVAALLAAVRLARSA